MKVARWLPCAVRGIGVSALRVDFVMRENMGKERCDAEGNREGKGDVRRKK